MSDELTEPLLQPNSGGDHMRKLSSQKSPGLSLVANLKALLINIKSHVNPTHRSLLEMNTNPHLILGSCFFFWKLSAIQIALSKEM
ncbi:hypothetical protein CEXT_609721 [Caerostris extrusa]|uniref:Uncharacterized protein n=1 Tax=Caerostris extrusa TaxID=172846 RepID=A0AAV4RFV6_CAEEX|nr:hypothetical protein CEXT_609721 [Caerostris extrusa]